MKGHNTAGNRVSNAVPNKKSYSVAEIQQILGISRPTAYNLIRQNYFQSVRVGSSIRVIKSSFDAWLDTAM
jgi:excisionase family DNA binding protein